MAWLNERVTRPATVLCVAAALTLLLGIGASRTNAGTSADDAPPAKADPKPDKPAPPKLGLLINEPKAYQGYTLLLPLMSTNAYLMDMQGKVVRTWETKCNPAASGYLLENGHLLRTGSLMGEEQSFGGGPAAGGRVQEFTLDGELVWDFRLFNEKQLPHHDLCKLPNGNVLMIVWDKKTAKEALAAGRRPELTGDSHLLPDSLVEVRPTGKTTGEIVWEWHLWDHLVQDFEKTKANYGNVAEHPELVNINYGEDALAAVNSTKAGQDALKSLGYVGANSNRQQRANPDWTHFNGVAYNADLDQVVVSVHSFSEFWILDHSTTTAEAATHTGGKSGKGGDLLYRWGNPRAYRAGTKADQKLFSQHNAHWIAHGLPGEGHLLVFNNGSGRPDGSYSSVDELALPVDSQGHYTYKPGTAYGPDKPVWSYTAPKKTDFFSFFISGAQRLPNGNTLICSGANGTFFEVTPDNEIVWKYVNPVKGSGQPGFSPPPPGQILPSFMQNMIGMSAEQKKQIEELQKDIDGKLAKLLTDDQKKQFKERPMGGGPGGFGGPPPQAGQIMAASEQDRLKLSADQKQELADIQKDVDERFGKILKEDQKKQLKDMAANFGRGGPGAPVPFPPGGPGGAPQPGQLLPGFLQDRVKLSADQKKELEGLQKEVDENLAKLLTEEQMKQFKERRGSGAFGGPFQPGQLMPTSQQITLKLSADQKQQLADLQKNIDGKLDKLFTDEQKKQLKDMKDTFTVRGPGGPGGGPGGGGGGPGGPPNFGPPGGSPVFRVYRFGLDHPGLVGKDLKPGKTVEELQPKEPEKKEPEKK
jgi:hypothetical protein